MNNAYAVCGLQSLGDLEGQKRGTYGWEGAGLKDRA